MEATIYHKAEGWLLCIIEGSCLLHRHYYATEAAAWRVAILRTTNILVYPQISL